MNEWTKIDIVLGLQWGDESKGKTVDWLCRQSHNPLVVRFSAGAQCGHTVITDQHKHIHASFPSGALNGHKGYVLPSCAFSPIHLYNEWKVLSQKQTNIRLSIHPLAHLTTPYEIAFNRATERVNKHGSCGKGVAATMKRNLESPHKLYAIDTTDEWVLYTKLKLLESYYRGKIVGSMLGYYLKELNSYLDIFWESVRWLNKQEDINVETVNLEKYEHVIFEGSQGILLDMDHGFFPHVTYANTTCKHIQWVFDKFNDVSTYYVTRAYSTRHGAGPFRSEQHDFPLKNTEEEINQENEWQGKFRLGPLDLDMLDYAYKIDSIYNRSANKNLCVTCADQVETVPELPSYYDNYYLSSTPKSKYEYIR